MLCVLGCMPAQQARALDPNKAFGQYVANRWSIQDGLPQISALAIAQDRDGYIWVGTQSGVARFDGVHFTSYTPDNTIGPDKQPQLPGIWVRALLVIATASCGSAPTRAWRCRPMVDSRPCTLPTWPRIRSWMSLR